jgi:hypothetical protein
MQSYLVCTELGAVLGPGFHARMGVLPGADSSLLARGGGGVRDSERINAIGGAPIFVVRESHGFRCCGTRRVRPGSALFGGGIESYSCGVLRADLTWPACPPEFCWGEGVRCSAGSLNHHCSAPSLLGGLTCTCRAILSVLSSGRCWKQGSLREWVCSQVHDLCSGRGGRAVILTGSI